MHIEDAVAATASTGSARFAQRAYSCVGRPWSAPGHPVDPEACEVPFASQRFLNGSARLRWQLIDDEKLIEHPAQPEAMLFTDDVPFVSPSAAAATVLNRNANGRTEWNVAGTGQTYEDWQRAQLPPTDDEIAE